MNLAWISLEGFRRFTNRTKLECSGKLVALVGPNEAGKSSTLDAIAHLAGEAPLRSDLSRGVDFDDDDLIVEGAFLLQEEDQTALKELGLPQVRWLYVEKHSDGARTFRVEPEPKRSKSLRAKVGRDVLRASKHGFLRKLELAEASFDTARLVGLANGLTTSEENLPSDTVNRIEEVHTLLTRFLPKEAVPRYIAALPRALQGLASVEGEAHPEEQACDLLKSRIPPIVAFSEQDRALRSDYNLAEVVPNGAIPKALANLAEAAGLNLQALWSAIELKDQPEVVTLRAAANDQLDEIFSTSWSQSDVNVRFHIDGASLQIQIEDPGRRFSSLGERSDGLRQFVALVAFTAVNHVRSPILLIDEAESHLHYDAQADLVQMLARQQVAQKVVYSTHSAGCLPEDLGIGVRLVKAEESTSCFVNWFWLEDGSGFSPLLFGMGASTLAFFPMRHALATEGPSDMILLPTLLREATGYDSIGFQVVPGISNTSVAHIGELSRNGRGVVYVVDADPGGARLRKKLLQADIKEDQIRALTDGRSKAETIEDLVVGAVFVESVNALLGKYQTKPPVLKESVLPRHSRATFIKNWCKRRGLEPIGKRELAYMILDWKANNAPAEIVEPRQRSQLQNLHKWAEERFSGADEV